MTKPETLNQHPEFSLVLGGPLFQLYRRTYLSGDALELVRRRVVVIVAIAWLPPLVLSMIDGHALGGAIALPFLHDIETHVRFLVALPTLISRTGPYASDSRKVSLERQLMPNEYLNSTCSCSAIVCALLSWKLFFLYVYTLACGLRNQVATGAASWIVSRHSVFHLTLADIGMSSS